MHVSISNPLGKKKAQLPPMEAKPSTEDILNAILPAREWVEDGMITALTACRQALHLVRVPPASIPRGRCSAARAARPEVDGATSA